MTPELVNRAVRVELGIPTRVAAKLAGVDRRTVTMFEAGPAFVSAEKRELLEKLYALFRGLLDAAPGARKGLRPLRRG